MLLARRVLLMAFTFVAATGRHGTAAADAMATWCDSERANTGPAGLSAADIRLSVMDLASLHANDEAAGVALDLSAKGVSNYLNRRASESLGWKRFKILPGKPRLYVVVPKQSHILESTLPPNQKLYDRRAVVAAEAKIESLEASVATLPALRAEIALLPAQRAENATLRAENATLRHGRSRGGTCSC
ncbi:hypothetical protein M885DRAFT_579078 [Pelagophyceae sp. CCMP2097]|nr:hypothetical protein M885DRAFT_579078 [Pelagophyceae sp. CCMP2097]